jgi:4-aminobutyrate aminotransferase
MDSVAANSISTFGGNPLVATGALAVLDYLAEHDLQANAATVGAHLAAGLAGLADHHPAVGDVRGKGLMLALELVEPGSKRPAAAVAAQVQEEARRGGLLVGKGGLYGNVLRIAPPLVLTEAEADEGLEILTGALAAAG